MNYRLRMRLNKSSIMWLFKLEEKIKQYGPSLALLHSQTEQSRIRSDKKVKLVHGSISFGSKTIFPVSASISGWLSLTGCLLETSCEHGEFMLMRVVYSVTAERLEITCSSSVTIPKLFGSRELTIVALLSLSLVGLRLGDGLRSKLKAPPSEIMF